MNTFPYDTWEEALEAGGGYFTWGPGSNTASYVLAILGIVLTIAWTLWIVGFEKRTLDHAASELNEKWGI